MNRESPVPLWAVLVVGGAMLTASYFLGTAGIPSPQFIPSLRTQISTITREPALSPRPSEMVKGSTMPADEGSAASSNRVKRLPSPDTAIKASANSLGTSAPNVASFQSSSTWATFTDPEDFYSIQYPNLGPLVIRYSPLPLKTILGWKGNGNFDVAISTVNSEAGLHLPDWLMKAHGINASSRTANIETITLNGMKGILVFTPTGGSVTAYMEQDFFGEPLIHEIEFTSYLPGIDYPPFWRTMLQTFRGLPWP